MSSESEDVQVAWKSLDWFRVKCQAKEFANAPLYANGRQQMPVEVYIRALDANGAVVVLSQSQLDSIKLIDYIDESPLHTTNRPDPKFE